MERNFVTRLAFIQPRGSHTMGTLMQPFGNTVDVRVRASRRCWKRRRAPTIRLHLRRSSKTRGRDMFSVEVSSVWWAVLHSSWYMCVAGIPCITNCKLRNDRSICSVQETAPYSDVVPPYDACDHILSWILNSM